MIASVARRLRIASAVLLALVIAPAQAARAQDAATERDTSIYNTIGVVLGYTSFNGDTPAWTDYSASFTHHGPGGSLIGRVNVSNHFATTGSQFEVDAYPRFSPGKYMYLNAGYSGSTIFPTERFGAEFYTNLPNAFEASLGIRALWFAGSPVTLFTGTVGMYTGNYWFSVRPFVHQTATGTSASAGLIMRHYTVDANNYIGGSVSFGSSPTDQITPDLIARTSSATFGLQGSATMGKVMIFTWNAGVDSEGLAPGHTRTGVGGSLGLSWRLP